MEENQELDLRYENKRQVVSSTILGFLIGLAIIVPGISGSTLAIIFRLYDKLIYAIGNIFKRFKVCIIFLLPIALGGVIGFLLGFITIQRLLEWVPFIVVACFAGLMLGAFPAVEVEIKNQQKTPLRIFLFILGFLIPIALGVGSTFLNYNNSLENLQIYHYFIFLLLGYIVAITQVVPGLSATALLMAFGYFKPLMEAVNFTYLTSNPAILLVFACLIIGFLIGIISFSKVLSKIFAKARITAFFMIVGLSLGSIISMFFNPDIYSVYQSWAHGNVTFGWDLGFGIALFIIGAILAYSFIRYERKKTLDEQK